MALRHLYLRVYLTMLAVLMVFALVAGLLVRRHTDSERGRIEQALSQRAAAWAGLLANSLPPADAPPAEQAAALQDWSQRLRIPLALDDAQGQRIAASSSFLRLPAPASAASADAEDELPALLHVPLADGRALWVPAPRPRGGLRGIGLRGPWSRPPGPDEGPGAGGRPGPAGPDGPNDPPPPRPWNAPRWLDEAGTLLALLGALFVAVAAGAWPVVRRLTRRLESLQRGVEVFGSGQLGHRVPVDGRDEVAALAASFNHAAERVEKLVQSHRSLLANASHELRSPLARLKMALAMQEAAGEDAARRQPLRQEIERNIRELDALVEEVLLASRLEGSPALPQEPVDLLGLLAEEAARVDADLDGEPLEVTGDERLLRRALRNLLENARRYGGEEVSARLRRSAPVRAELTVCDRGPGVPETYRERVFEPFFRLPGHAEREGGVGLGLALLRQIARQHGGEVRCEAREGGGSCFVLTLPIRGCAG